VWKRFKLRRGRASIRVTRTVGSTRDIVYRGFVSRSSKLLQQELRYRDPRYPDEPRTVHQFGTHVRRSKGSRGSEHRRFRGQETLAVWNRDPRYPDGRVVWATQELVEDRWHTSIGDREKESPESIDIRIRDPANSEIPIR
jgi:hypothetical protein